MTVPPAERARVLLVDDDPGVLRVVHGMLSGLGLAVDEVTSGAEAVARLGCDAYDLLITDLGIPDLDGWRIVEEARRLAPGIAVILATASASTGDRDRARAIGLDLVAKPFTLARLRSAIDGVRRTDVPAPALLGRAGGVPAGAGPPAGSSPQLVGEMRAILDAVRSTLDDLAGVVAHTEAQADNCREACGQLAEERRRHAATVEALRAFQARYETLSAERRETLSLLEEVARRLRS